MALSAVLLHSRSVRERERERAGGEGEDESRTMPGEGDAAHRRLSGNSTVAQIWLF